MLIERAFKRAAEPASRITAVGTLAAARRVFAESRPDLAIIDAHLPDGRGVDLLAEKLPCPVVIMTSQEHSKTAAEAKALGALDYVVKSPTVFRRLPELALELTAAGRGADVT